MYWIYVLKSDAFEKSYVGHTNDLEKRLIQHNSGQTVYTKKYRPWKIIYTEEFKNLTDAVNREKYLKSRSGRRFLKNMVFG